jgi:hypothetical protein
LDPLIRVLTVAKSQNKAVSEILGIEDRYIAFCIDEAAAYVYFKILDKKEPVGKATGRNDGLELLLKVAEEKK